MFLKRLSASILLIVMMGSLLLLQNSSLANDDLTDSPLQIESGFDDGALDPMVDSAEQTDAATLTPEEPPTGDPSALTETGTPSSEPSENADNTETADDSASSVFLAGTAYQIEVNGTEAAGGAQLTAQLEAQNPDATWSAVEDPNQPNEAYTILLALDANGAAGGQFLLEGFSNACAYRARIAEVSLPESASGLEATFDYTDLQLDEQNWKTTAQMSLRTPAAEEPGEATAVYTSKDVFSVSINASIVPEAEFEPFQIALYSSADGEKSSIAELTLTPDETGSAQGAFLLEGLPSNETYTASAIAYGKEPLEFVLDETLGEKTASVGDFVVQQTQSDLALAISLEPATNTEDASLSLFGALEFSAFATTSTPLGAYDSAYEFTLNLSLNGSSSVALPVVYIVTEHTDTGSYTVAVDSYSELLASATASVSGKTVTLTLKPITAGEELFFQLTMDVESLSYSLSGSSDAYITSISSGASGAFVDGEASATASAMEQTDYTFSVRWNDNKAVDRPTPTFSLLANGTALSAQPTAVKTVVSYNEDSYTYSDLPKYENGTEIVYGISQDALTNYHTEISGNTVENTRTQTLVAYVQWNDASTKTQTRPSSGDAGFIDHFSLKRKAQSASAVTQTLTFPSYSLDTTGDHWTFSIPNLVSFDEDGFPYDYMLVQSAFTPADTTYGSYHISAKNVGVYNGQVSTDTAYNGGTLINTISDRIGFSFHNEWVDNNEVSPRPDVRYYLYRYPTNSSQDYLTLAPVTGYDNRTLADKSTSVDITYAAEDTLPRYDLLGNTYVYYIRVIMPNPGDYKIRISNPYDTQTDFLLPGGTVTYIREATTNVNYTVSWIAKAVQTMKGGVAVYLESRLSGDETSVWTAVDGAQQTLSGFRTETMTLSSSFSSLPKYNASGARILYRVLESGATIDVTGGIPTDNIVGDGSFTSGGHAFLAEQPASGDTSNTIYNRIVGTTKLTVRKHWNEALAEGVTGSINVHLLRNGSSSWTSDSITLPEGATSLGSNVYTLVGTGNFEKMFSNLPKYDSEGRAYAYTVSETVNEPLGYSLSDIVYSFDADQDPIATIYNTNQTGGSSLVFRVNKIWLDDGDLLQRVPVTFWLYYRNDDGTTYTRVPDVALTIDAADAWTGLIHFVPSGEYENDYSRYIVREVTNGSLTLAGNGTQTYLDSGAGEAQTATQKYVVSTEKSGSQIYNVTNRRIGKVQITISKNWAFLAFSSDNPIAKFGLYADDVLIDDTKTIALADASATIVYGASNELEKFNSQGEMINYSVRELGVTDAVGNPLNLKTDETIVSSVTPGTYVVSTDLSLPDTMGYTFQNSLGGNGSLRVNIIWRDTLADASTRPDIRLQLYRTTDTGVAVPEYVTTMRLWDTNHEQNSWYWTCDFGTYPAFDSAGNRYYYYTKAVALQSSRYSVSYFSDVDGTDSNINAAGTDTKSTFDLGVSEAFDTTQAYLNFDNTKTGVVILTLADTQDIVRYKIWRNLPSWFLQSSLPTTYFKLYRTLTPLEELTGSSVTEAVQKDGADWIVALTNNASTATFADLPVYDRFGTRYYYFVEEVNASGSLFNVDWYTISDDKTAGTVTNTYLTGSMNPPVVAVQIVKTWDFGGALDADQLNYPATTYDLHQYWKELDGIHETGLVHDGIVKTTTIPSGAISTLVGGTTVSAIVTTDASDNLLPMYTPDGQKFVYYFVERSLTGYATTYTDAPNGRSLAVFAEGETTGVAAITNTYQPTPQTTKVATKVWADQSNLYLTRPSVSGADSAIAYTLWRKTPGSDPAVNLGLTGVWTQDSGNTNQWLCTFTGTFPTYTTLGQSYQYYVTEALSGSTAINYKLTSGTGTLKLTNTLNQVNVQLSKSWRAAPEEGETIGALFDQAELEDLAEIGAMPDSVKFNVLQKRNGVTESTREVEVTWSTLLNNALKGKRYVLVYGLPQYFPDAASTSDEYVYEIEETKMVYKGVEKTVSEAGFTMTSALADGSKTITEITNQIATQKLYFVKNWEDENNRDGVRPSSIVLTVTSVGSGASATVTLSPSTTSSDPSSDASRTSTSTGNRWRAEMTVPLSSLTAGYTVSENTTALSALGYSPSAGDPATQSDLGGNPNWWGFTNTRAIKTIALEASKVWAGENGWDALTRPASVSLQLQYRAKGTTNWITLGSAVVLPLAGQTWADAKASWTNLPAYMPKTVSSDTTTLREYRVVEASITGYTTSYSKSLIDGSVAAMPAVQTLTVTNTLKTISVSGKKTWVDANNRYLNRPTSISLSLLANGAALSSPPTPVWQKPANSSEWTYQYSNLPRYFTGSSTPVVYSVVETPVASDYSPTSATTALGTVNPTSGVVTAADFTNTLGMVSVSGSKTWLDNGDYYKMRPSDISLTLLADGTALEHAPDPEFSKSGNTWSYVFSNLPRYRAGTTTPIVYSVLEAPVAGYETTTDSESFGTVDAATRNVTGANFTNALITIDLSGTKTWVDDQNRYLTRPDMDEMELTLYENGVSMSTSSKQPVFVWRATGAGDVWAFTATGVPMYQKGTSTKAVYTIAETPVVGYQADSTGPISGTTNAEGDLSGFAWVNTLQIVSIQGSKQWIDQANRYGTRPGTLTLTVLADGVAIAQQPEVIWNKTGDTWTYSIQKLPRNRTGSSEAIVYSVRETAAAGYTPDHSGPVAGSVDSNGNVTNVNFVNQLATVSIRGTKNWEDQKNRFGTRPTSVELTLLADGTALTAAPTPKWDTTSAADAWTFVFENLPRYRKGTSTPVIYTVRETQVEGYAALTEQSGVVDSATGEIAQVNLTNRLLYELEIDNSTRNTATGQSDAGGTVYVSGTMNAQRDMDPYKDQAVSVSWKAETLWEVKETFSVRYLPHGAAEEDGWQSVSVTNGDLSALRSIPYFADASIKTVDGLTTLTLAEDYRNMPYRTSVLVTFQPTLAVYNTTANHGGGTVEIKTANTTLDGRYVALLAYGNATGGYAVDLSNLTLLVPTEGDGSGVDGVVALNWLIRTAHAAGTSTKVSIRPNASGAFSTTMNLNLGGTNRDVTITGTVKVLSLDQNQNPTKVVITLDSLPAPLDVGIPFIVSSSIPATGDPVNGIAMVFVVSGLALAYLTIRLRKSQTGTRGTRDNRR